MLCEMRSRAMGSSPGLIVKGAENVSLLNGIGLSRRMRTFDTGVVFLFFITLEPTVE